MMLVEETSVPSAALPVAAFREHLRLGTGFSDDGLQDAVLESFLQAAMAAIEARTGKVLIARVYSWNLTAWRDPGEQAMPVAPVSELLEIRVIDTEGTETVIPPASYRLLPDSQRPRVRSVSGVLPFIPHHGSVEIRFRAGFGEAWADVPRDLAQAVMLLAAHYYEYRQNAGYRDGAMPFGVSSLIERFRTIRLLGGARR